MDSGYFDHTPDEEGPDDIASLSTRCERETYRRALEVIADECDVGEHTEIARVALSLFKEERMSDKYDEVAEQCAIYLDRELTATKAKLEKAEAEAKALREALEKYHALCETAIRHLQDNIIPDSPISNSETVNRLLGVFDGLGQREAFESRAALALREGA